MGIGAHINVLMEMCEGELVVVGGGDDISRPERVAVLVQKWLEYGKPAAIGSAVKMIDEEGKAIGEASANETVELGKQALLDRERMLGLYQQSKPY